MKKKEDHINIKQNQILLSWTMASLKTMNERYLTKKNLSLKRKLYL